MSKNRINLETPIASLVEQYPHIQQLMADVGFVEITKPIMLRTVGKVMTLKKGCAMRNIPLEKVIATFEKHGFEIEHTTEEETR
ncbi:MAG: DUF1858 domain-containing protein [Sphaerochaetaceae bacterium]|jgi:hypothetical protein